jgi:hypothetical protein
MPGARWAAVVLLSMPLAGCDEMFTAGGVATLRPTFVRITHKDLWGVGTSSPLPIELDGEYPVVFEFDGRAGAIDFDRVELTTPEGEVVSMDVWLARQFFARELDFAEGPKARFRLANDPDAATLGLARDDPPAPDGCGAIDVVDVDAVFAVVLGGDDSCAG